MKILCFDTCFNKSYVVLGDEISILQSKIIESDDKNYHSAYLIPTIRDILVQNNILIKDLDAIVVNIGPGSFTGVRSGVTIARVLCQQFNTKLIGIPSLEIISHLKENHTTVVLDARKNKVYFGEYNKGKEVTKPCLKDKDEVISCLNSYTTIISDSSINAFLKENGINSINYEEEKVDYGVFSFEIAKNLLKNNENDFNWAKVKPLYIQKPSITKPKEKTDVR